MNLKVLQWLLKYKRELLEIVNVAKRFRNEMPLGDKWTLIDEIAKIVIPIVENETKVLALLDETDPVVSALSVEGEVQAMAIDWATLVDVILPIIISILQALVAKKGE